MNNFLTTRMNTFCSKGIYTKISQYSHNTKALLPILISILPTWKINIFRSEVIFAKTYLNNYIIHISYMNKWRILVLGF